jgi:hypothetical protein
LIGAFDLSGAAVQLGQALVECDAHAVRRGGGRFAFGQARLAVALPRSDGRPEIAR